MAEFTPKEMVHCQQPLSLWIDGKPPQSVKKISEKQGISGHCDVDFLNKSRLKSQI